jgi:hypothetical protein
MINQVKEAQRIYMKALLLTACLLSMTASVLAQGSVIFANNVLFPTPADRLVYDSSGAPLVGESYVAQLYYGPVGSFPLELTAVNAPPRTFREPGTTVPGTWIGQTRRLEGFSVGNEVLLQVRVWDSALAGSYEEALSGLKGLYGASELFTYVLPPPGSRPQEFMMDNLRNFTLKSGPSSLIGDSASVPEPAALALALLGGLAVSIWRRNRSEGDSTEETVGCATVQRSLSRL